MTAEIEEDIYKFKIILAGEGAVGKTTLINRFITGTFSGDYKATIGVAIFSKRIMYNGNDVSLQIWDIAGQTLFKEFRKKFFTQARGAILVFDVTVPQTLDSLHTWIDDIHGVTGEIPLILLGNKVDLTNLTAITSEEIDEFLSSHSNIGANFLTSALTGEKVEESFSNLISLMI